MAATSATLKNIVALCDSHLQSTSTTQNGCQVPTYSFNLDRRRKAYLRLLGDVHTQIANAQEEEKRGPRKLTQAKMAAELGCDKSTLHRKMKKSANITLESLSELALALDREVLFFLSRRDMAQALRHAVDKVCQVEFDTKIGDNVAWTTPISLSRHRTARQLTAGATMADRSVSFSEGLSWLHKEEVGYCVDDASADPLCVTPSS